MHYLMTKVYIYIQIYMPYTLLLYSHNWLCIGEYYPNKYKYLCTNHIMSAAMAEITQNKM